MLRLNGDILYLIFEELQNDRKTFYSCLSVNKTWNEIIIPILWKNPWKYLKRGKEKLLLNVIISHLSDELRDNLSPDTNPSTYLYQRPSFNYISFCRHLNLNEIINIVYVESKIPIITNNIFNLFINKNTKFTHLYIPSQFNYQIHLIPGAKQCLSELETIYCNTGIEDGVLDGLLEMCKSIRILELYIDQQDINHGIIKLIEAPKKLCDVRFVTWEKFDDESFCKILENSLIKHANTIQYFEITKQPATKILSSFKNLKRLELEEGFYKTWNCLEDLSLPLLQILEAKSVPIKALISLIENTSGNLTEINISYDNINDIDNKRIIQAIYQKCPNLNYLKILFINSNILELENLLINCKYLNGLAITTFSVAAFNWGNLLEILSKSSPTGLYKFKIFSSELSVIFKSLEMFFNNWRGKHPMLLQIIPGSSYVLTDYFFDLIEKYKAEGIIKKFDYDFGQGFEDFEWIKEKF